MHKIHHRKMYNKQLRVGQRDDLCQQLPQVRTVNKVVEGHKIVQSQQIIEYERPKMIQARFMSLLPC
jgi:hypothetical protein